MNVRTDHFMGGFVSVRAIESGPDTGSRLIERARQLPDVIALGRGDPDLATPTHIVAAAKRAMDSGQTHYTAHRGLESLRVAVAAKLERDNGLHVDPDDEVLITTGAQEAMVVTALCLLNPGDEIILPDPYYFSYEHAIRYAGGKLVTVPTSAAGGFAPDPDDIDRAITARTKAIVLLTPNNPTGAVYPQTTLEAIAEISLSRGIPVVSDELYEKTVFGDSSHFSIGGVPGMRDQTITINGFSKSYRMTGWRIGYMVGPSSFVGSAQQVKQTLTICAPTISQHAAIAALDGPQDCIQEALDVYGERRVAFLRGLDEIGMQYFRPSGTFYVFADISPFGMDADQFCLQLLEDARVFVYPGSHFGPAGDNYVRISMLAPTASLLEGLSRMARFLERLKGA
jgi:aminotransferase